MSNITILMKLDVGFSLTDGRGTHHPEAIFASLGGRLGSLSRDLTSALPSAARPLIGRLSEEPRPRLRRLLGSCGRGRAAAAWEKESRGRHAVAAGGEARGVREVGETATARRTDDPASFLRTTWERPIHESKICMISGIWKVFY